jgi:hypothetical protein
MNFRKSAVLSLVFSIIFPLLLPALGGREQLPANPRGVIEYLEGDVLVNGSAAEIGQEIPPGASVQTGEASFCIILFAGKNIFRIQEQSIAIIEIDESLGSIDLKQGGLAAVFSKLQTLSSSGGTFRIQTPTAAAGVRGTAFYVQVEDENNTYICTCNGQLGIEDVEQSNSRSVKSDYHAAYRFSRSGEGIRLSPAPLLYHNDATMNLLAAKIRIRIPWGKAGSSGSTY